MLRPLVLTALVVTFVVGLGACQRDTSPDPSAAATIPALVAAPATAIAPPASLPTALPLPTLAGARPTAAAGQPTARAAQPTRAPTATPAIAASPTDTQYIRFLINVNLRSGPGVNYPRIGQIFAGQTAKVTGVSANKGWWRVICPDGTSGNCWVSADPKLTQPTTPP